MNVYNRNELDVIFDSDLGKTDGKSYYITDDTHEFITGLVFHDAVKDIQVVRDGNIHCETGPAVIQCNGDVEWWLNDQIIELFDDYVVKAGWSDEQIVEWKLKGRESRLEHGFDTIEEGLTLIDWVDK